MSILKLHSCEFSDVLLRTAFYIPLVAEGDNIEEQSAQCWFEYDF